MAEYRKTVGGIFAPVDAMSIKTGDNFQSISEKWICDGGVFKKTFPSKLDPVDASDSGLYNTASALGGMVGFSWGSGTKYSLVGFYSAHKTATDNGARIPLTGTNGSTISSSVCRIKDANGNIIPTGTGYSLTGTAGTSTADITLFGLADERLDILTYVTFSGVVYLTTLAAATNATLTGGPVIRDKEYPVGTIINMEWEWTIAGQAYYFNFPPYTLAE